MVRHFSPSRPVVIPPPAARDGKKILCDDSRRPAERGPARVAGGGRPPPGAHGEVLAPPTTAVRPALGKPPPPDRRPRTAAGPPRSPCCVRGSEESACRLRRGARARGMGVSAGLFTCSHPATPPPPLPRSRSWPLSATSVTVARGCRRQLGRQPALGRRHAGRGGWYCAGGRVAVGAPLVAGDCAADRVGGKRCLGAGRGLRKDSPFPTREERESWRILARRGSSLGGDGGRCACPAHAFA